MKNNIFLGALLCFIASVSWGAMFPVAHHAFTYIDPFYFTIFRYGAVSIILVLLLLWKEGPKAFRLEGKGGLLWFFGTMAFTVYNLLIFWGEDLLGEPGVMVASIMESLMPMISIIIVWLFYRRRPYSFTILCVVVSFVGAILVITKGDIASFLTATNNIIPSILILIAVIGWVIYTMGGDKFRGWSVLRYSTLSCLLGTISAVVIVAIATMVGYVSVPAFGNIQTVSPHLLFMIVFPGVIALVGWNIGVSILSPLNALLFINFVPVTTLVISSVQGNHISSFEIIGVGFIILALLANNIFVRLIQKKETSQQVKQSLQESIS
ncbi:MAG: DMT family transporter [Psychrobacillus psychrotolerans]